MMKENLKTIEDMDKESSFKAMDEFMVEDGNQENCMGAY